MATSKFLPLGTKPPNLNTFTAAVKTQKKFTPPKPKAPKKAPAPKPPLKPTVKAPSPRPPKAPTPTRVVPVRAHTRTVSVKPPAKPTPETLPHAVTRMHNQGFSDNAIRGQIKTWHPSWSDAKILNTISAARAARTTYSPTSGLGAEARAVNQPSIDTAPGLNTGDLKTLHKASNAPIVQILGQATNPIDLVTGAVGGVKGFSNRPGIGTGIGAGLGLAGILPFGRGLRALKDATAAEDVLGAEKVVPKAGKVAPFVATGHYEGVDTFPRVGTGYSYHTTPHGSFEGIRTKGLEAKAPPPHEAKPGGDEKGVYFARNPLRARSLSGKPLKGSVFLRTKTSNLRDVSERAFAVHLTPHSVPPEHLEYFGSDRQWHPVAGNGPTPEQKLAGSFQALKKARASQDVGYSVARSEKAAKLREIQTNPKLTGEQKLAASREALKGELPKVFVNGDTHQMTQDDLNHLISTAMNHPGLREYQKHTVANALDQLVREGRAPQNYERKLMEKVWGKQTVGSLMSNTAKFKNGVLSVLNVPRAIESTLDQSFGLRQGLVAAFYDPKNWWKSYSHSFSYLNKYLGSGEKGYQQLVENIHNSPNIRRYEIGKLAITDLEHDPFGPVNNREEMYQSNLAEHLPVVGHAIRGAGRGYTGAALAMRTSIADKLLNLADRKGYDINDPQFLKDTMSFVNAITGRGNLPTKTLQESAPLLNALFFSPRLLGSRLQMLSEPFNIALARRNPLVWRQYVKANAKTFGTLGLILASIRKFVPGASVNMNPRSSDFGKIRVGDTRIDLLGGFNQVFHQAGEQYTGQKISSTTGKLESLTSGKYGQPTRFDELINFLKGKEAPSPGIVTDFLTNQNPNHFGRKFSWVDEAKSHLVPLAVQDAEQMYTDPLHGMNPILAALLGYGFSGSGVGVQTYAPQPSKARGAGSGSVFLPSSGGSRGGSRFLP